MFSCEYCEIFGNSFFIEHLWWLLLKRFFQPCFQLYNIHSCTVIFVSSFIDLLRISCLLHFNRKMELKKENTKMELKHLLFYSSKWMICLTDWEAVTQRCSVKKMFLQGWTNLLLRVRFLGPTILFARPIGQKKKKKKGLTKSNSMCTSDWQTTRNINFCSLLPR